MTILVRQRHCSPSGRPPRRPGSSLRDALVRNRGRLRGVLTANLRLWYHESPMTGHELRERFLRYFERNGHAIVRSSPLVPAQDPTLLFTNAGMVQFKSVFLGEERRDYVRATTCQKCVRAGGKHNDLENVGYTARHHTFFEMLGNFSFGDYFKRRGGRLRLGVRDEGPGNPAGPPDGDRLHRRRRGLRALAGVAGLPAEKILRLGEKDNFWAMGDTGPCGPVLGAALPPGRSPPCAEVAGRPVVPRPGVRVRPVARDLEPGLHAVRPGRLGQADAAAEAVDRHRDGPGADHRGGAGRGVELPHGPAPAARRPRRAAEREALRRARGRRRLDAGHRRPRPGGGLPDLGPGAAVQRVARLRPAPDHAPGDAPRPAPRPDGAVPLAGDRHGGGDDGRVYPELVEQRDAGGRDRAAGGGALRRDPGRGHDADHGVRGRPG